MLWHVGHGHRSFVERGPWAADLAHPKIWVWRPLCVQLQKLCVLIYGFIIVQFTNVQPCVYLIAYFTAACSLYKYMHNIVSRQNCFVQWKKPDIQNDRQDDFASHSVNWLQSL